jgi:hypothetical protein
MVMSEQGMETEVTTPRHQDAKGNDECGMMNAE